MINAIEPALPQPGKIKRRFAQRLAWRRAGVEARAIRLPAALDQCNALSEVGRLRRALFPRRSRTNHERVK